MNKQIKKYIWNKKMNLKNKIISKKLNKNLEGTGRHGCDKAHNCNKGSHVDCRVCSGYKAGEGSLYTLCGHRRRISKPWPDS